MGKSNLHFAGMRIAINISVEGLNLLDPTTRQVRSFHGFCENIWKLALKTISLLVKKGKLKSIDQSKLLGKSAVALYHYIDLEVLC